MFIRFCLVSLMVSLTGCVMGVNPDYVPTTTLEPSTGHAATVNVECPDLTPPRQFIEEKGAGTMVFESSVEKSVEKVFTKALALRGYTVTKSANVMLRIAITEIGPLRGANDYRDYELPVTFRVEAINHDKFVGAEVISFVVHRFFEGTPSFTSAYSKAIDDYLAKPNIVAILNPAAPAYAGSGDGHAPPEAYRPTTAPEPKPVNHNVIAATPDNTPTALSTPSGGDRWAIVVGVSQYQFAGQAGLSNLAYADKDAQDFAAELKRQGWGEDHVLLLTNDHAKKRDVEHALEAWLRRASPADDIVFFWSGRGAADASDSTQAYFACHDAQGGNASSGIRLDYLRLAIAARKPQHVIVIADTCHNGPAGDNADPRTLGIAPALEWVDKKKDIPSGWVFIASSDADRHAYEDKAWKHGALTYTLLEGLTGKADGYHDAGPKDGVVNLAELREYVRDRMTQESDHIVGAKLLPLFYSTSEDSGIWKIDLQGK